jgi:hypothetical protein
VCVNQALTANNTVFNMKITFGGIVKALGGGGMPVLVLRININRTERVNLKKKESGVLEFSFYTPD